MCLYTAVYHASTPDYRSQLQVICDRKEGPAKNYLHRIPPGKNWTESFSQRKLNPDYKPFARKALSTEQTYDALVVLRSCKSSREAVCTWCNFCQDYAVEDDSRRKLCSLLKEDAFFEERERKQQRRVTMRYSFCATLCAFFAYGLGTFLRLQLF